MKLQEILILTLPVILILAFVGIRYFLIYNKGYEKKQATNIGCMSALGLFILIIILSAIL